MSTKKKCFNCTEFGCLSTCLKFDRKVKATHTCKHFKSRREEKGKTYTASADIDICPALDV